MTSVQGAVRLPSLTSLRWFAATAVFLRHVGGTFDWKPLLRVTDQGNTGVSFFFVLSGFVLAWTFRADDTFQAFARRRFARVYPAYALVALGSIPFLIAIGVFTDATDVVVALFTVTLLQAWVPSARIGLGGTGVAWSLSDEAFFYLNFTWMIRLIDRWSDRLVGLTAFALATCAIAIPAVLRAPDTTGFRFWFSYLSPATRMLEFALGICACVLLRRGLRLRIPLPAAIGLTVVAYLAAGWVPVYLSWVAVTLVPYTILIFVCAQRDIDGTTPPLLRSRFLMDLGAWSYAFYLIHNPIARGLDGLMERIDAGTVVRIVAIVAIYVGTVFASYLLYRFVEHPFEQRLRRRRAPQPAG